jgi:hypothetical protein
VPPTTEGLATASLALAIAGIPFGMLCGIGVLFEIAALPMGIVARRRIRESNGRLTGDGLAIGGIAVSAVVLVLTVLLVVLLVVLGNVNNGSTS